MRAMFVLVVVGVLLFAGLSAVNAQHDAAVEGNGDTTAITNETLNVSGSAGQTLSLADSNRDVDTTIYVRQSEVTMTQNNSTISAGGNWDWNRDDGTITIANSPADLNTSQNASDPLVDYGYNEETAAQGYARDMSTLPHKTGDAMVVILGGATVLTGLAWLRRAGR